MKILFLIALGAIIASAKDVQVSMRGHWSDTSLLAEACEAVNDLGGIDAFWSCADFVSKEKDKLPYRIAQKAIENLVSKEALPVASIGLHSRRFSPLIASHFQLLTQQLDGNVNCGSPVLLTADQYHCSVSPSAAAALLKPVPTKPIETTVTDRPLPESDSYPLVIYGILGDEPTHALIQQVKALNIPFVFRHHYGSVNSNTKLPMQGYGVYMDVKNTEYKTTDERTQKKMVVVDQEVVAGINLTVLSKRFSGMPLTATKAKLSEIALKDFEIQEGAFKVPFWQMTRAPMQIVDYVMGDTSSTTKANQTLGRLADLTSNFPLRMGAVLRSGTDTQREDRIVSALQQLWDYVPAGTCTLTVDGQSLRPEEQDFFHVLDIISAHEKHLLSLTKALEINEGRQISLSSQKQLPDMIRHLGDCPLPETDAPPSVPQGGNTPPPRPPESFGERYWVDTDLVVWINNVEKDLSYQRLRPTFTEVLRVGPYYQPLFPRRNLFNLIYIIDPADTDTVANVRALQSYLNQGFAARFGILFVDSANITPNHEGSVPQSLSSTIMAAFRAASLAGLTQDFIISLINNGITDTGVAATLSSIVKKDARTLLSDPGFIKHYAKVQAHAHQLGLRTFPVGVFNGILFPSLDRILFNGFDADFPLAREWVKSGELTDEVSDIYTWMMEKHKALKRFQGLLKDPTYIQVSEVPELAPLIAKAPYLYSKSYSLEAVLESNLLILSNQVTPLEWTLLTRFVNYVAACGEECVQMRFTILFVGDGRKSVIAQFVSDLLAKLSTSREERRITLLHSILSAISSDSYQTNSRANLISLAKTNGVTLADESNELEQHTSNPRLQATLGPLPLVLSNGRILPIDESFIEADFGSLFAKELPLAEAISGCLEKGNIHGLYDGLISSDDIGSEFVATKIALVSSVILLKHDSASNAKQPLQLNTLDAITVKYGPRDGYRHTFHAVIDPTKREGQRLVGMLQALSTEVTSANFVIMLNPPNGLSDVSMTTFYRFVFENTFAVVDVDYTKTLAVPIAHFVNLPSNIVFTMGVDEPEAWMVFADAAEADLDNLKLEDTATVTAEYGLHSILITGKCVDVDRQSAPKNLPLVLQTIKADFESVSDTTVMSNFAYFQLRAQFGFWKIGIQAGETAAKYKVMDLIETEANVYRRAIMKLRPENQRTTHLMVSSFSGSFVHLQVRAASATDSEHRSAEKARAERAALALNRGSEPTLNIFSVASGHLYERFLRMMFHTVVNASNAGKAPGESRVKFWLIENFLSPRFKKFLPDYAKKQGFEYQFISYHWPHWLRRQSQKQRTIWAYKILFLDVLFPLSLNKVIFVDADQIVRADLHELYNMHLDNKPMAYTPFCQINKNTDTQGFRFWDSGFWVDHLQGRPYHISAIYVVDLKRLRQMSGGDQYRMVYEQLSADPNSLANLDQDLPNYVQHQVPIFSLPEEWLWCETWCNAESKKRAKTIDLCNNPKTKIPKLENAKRIIPEWTSLDESLDSF